MADKDKETEDFEIVDALKEGTDGGPVEITESGLTPVSYTHLRAHET